MSHISEYYRAFTGRPDRYDFLRERYHDDFAAAKQILDVGCDDNYLKQHFGDKVFGIDIGGSPDRLVDLEKESLRFLSDKSFDVTICTEVLEHIDNLHEVFNDLLRVTNGIVIISLPNTISRGRIKQVLRKHRTGKFYGLPFAKPVDRHKWYFSYQEIVEFFVHHCQAKNIHLREILYHYPVQYDTETRPLHRLKQFLQAKWVKLTTDRNTAVSVFVIIDTTRPYES
jgi:2-polyprenyl-3-methyl-5-hydroxy-6-metoxy-1,4-benzoquinol methylase